MNKINKNKIVFGLAIMAALVFGGFRPLIARAQYSTTFYTGNGGADDSSNYDSDYNPYNTPYNNNENTVNQVPVIFSLSPDSVNATSGTVVVGINGNYFVPGAIARWNGLDRQTTFVNSEYLQMLLTNTDTVSPGSYSVSVYNPEPGGGFSNAAYLTISVAPSSTYVPATTNTATTLAVKKTSAVTKTITASNNGSAAASILGLETFLPSSLIQWLVFLILVLLVVVLWRKVYLSEQDKNKPLKHA